MSKTYFLVPTRDTPPNGPIFLGSIIKSPRSPELSVNGKTSPLLSALDVVVTKVIDSSRQITHNGKGKTGVWVEFLSGMGIGAEVSGNWDDIEQSTYKFDELITQTIAPSFAEIVAIFNEPDVQQFLKDSRFRDNLYMITGIKIARGADIAVSKIKSKGGNFNFGIDTTPFGVPIKIGPDVEISKEAGQSYEEKHTDDFVFAYRLREIRYRKKAVEDQREYRKGDLLGAGPRKKNEEQEVGVGPGVQKGPQETPQDEVVAEAELVGLGKNDVDGDAWDADTALTVDDDGDEVHCVLLEDDED
ncbi:hypothetical protein VTL71DRAFT_15718 [Oculimacula yallundae]|uniref:Uncharacterized protein n=1 Tax=Oculimacula yallundae TaxID=86028 RepID=A0ABR4CDN6_9HELO